MVQHRGRFHNRTTKYSTDRELQRTILNFPHLAAFCSTEFLPLAPFTALQLGK